MQYDPSRKCKISLKSCHGRFMCAEDNGGLTCNRPWCQVWEHFISEPRGNGKVSLLSYHGKYVCAEGNLTACANRGHCKEWEHFRVVSEGNRFGFVSHHNKYLSAQSNHSLQWNRDWFQPWEKFEVIVHEVIIDARQQAEEARRRAEELRRQVEAQQAQLQRLRDEARAQAAARQRADEEARAQAAARQRAEEEARRRADQLQQQKAAQRAQLTRSRTALATQLQEKTAAHNEANRRLTEINTQIANEEREIAQFRAERADASTKIIITLGMTGGGKSTLCNRLKGDESTFGNQGGFATSGDGRSCTQSNSKTIVRVGQHRITVVDTPGFNDSMGRDRTHSNRLCQYLKGCGGINAFVLVRNGSIVRFDAAFQAMLREYHAMFGDAFFTRLVIVATHVEGFVKMRFEQNNQERALRDDICRMFGLNIQIPVVPIGFEGYRASLTALANTIPSDKKEFRQIKSPIDELRCRQSGIADEERRLNQQKQRVQRDLNQVDAELRAL